MSEEEVTNKILTHEVEVADAKKAKDDADAKKAKDDADATMAVNKAEEDAIIMNARLENVKTVPLSTRRRRRPQMSMTL